MAPAIFLFRVPSAAVTLTLYSICVMMLSSDIFALGTVQSLENTEGFSMLTTIWLTASFKVPFAFG